MDRVFNSGAAASAPTPPASPSTGYATAGNPGAGTPPTEPGPWWFHMITEELRAVIVAAGLTPDHENVAQLSEAIAALSGDVADASTTVKGIVELATSAEAVAGTDTVRAVTPAGVKAVIDTLTTWPGIYTGSDANNLVFPLGTTLSVTGANGTRNSAVPSPGLDTATSSYGISKSTNLLAGVWRYRGLASGDSTCLIERTE